MKSLVKMSEYFKYASIAFIITGLGLSIAEGIHY